jgi:Leucine-rich repeat (LRR) protein
VVVVGTLVRRVAGQAACEGFISAAEYDALEALYNSTNGDYWTWNQDIPVSTIWTFPSTLYAPCKNQWQGIACASTGSQSELSDPNCTVAAVYLPFYNLQGYLPTQLEHLSSLQNLTVSFNEITSTIPTQLAQLSLLEVLFLSANLFSGQLPSELFSLPELIMIDVDTNSLTGSFPQSAGSCVLCERLDVSVNFLSGAISTTVGQLLSVQVLYLYSNFFSSTLPSEIGLLVAMEQFAASFNSFSGSISSFYGQLANIEGLYLDNNRLDASIPTELGLLTTLQNLELSTNSLVGCIPTEFGSLMALQVLYLYSNSLSCNLPTEFGELTSLLDVELNLNSLTGAIPSELGSLFQLQILYLFANCLSHTLPVELAQVLSLQQLDASQNCISGSIPSQLGLLHQMNLLFMCENYLSSTLPPELGQLLLMSELLLCTNLLSGSITPALGNLTALEYLYLFSNALTASIPTEFGQLSLLWGLDLYSNSLSGSIPTQVGLILPVQELYLHSNQLSANIPTQIGQLVFLQDFSVTGNSLTGVIPTEIGLLTGLQDLNLGTNLFSSSVPSEVGQMTSLAVLILGTSYGLTGPLPSQIGQLSLLEEINIQSTGLSGPLPSQVGLLTGLQVVSISANQFSSTIPSELGELSAVELLDLSSNRLSGKLPTELGQLLAVLGITLGVNLLSGSIPTEIALLGRVEQFFVNANLLTGDVKPIESLSQLTQVSLGGNYLTDDLVTFPPLLEFVDLSGNEFEGPFDDSLLDCVQHLVFIDMSGNILTGTAPSYFMLLSGLEELNVSNNALSGSIDRFVFGDDNSSVTSMDLSNNYFSGSLPSAFFTQPLLQTVVLQDNCFSGSLPTDLCSGANLEILFLDSLTGNCDSKLPAGLGRIMKGSFPNRLIKGGIPSCLWSLTRLQQLHLSGNGLTGTLGEVSAASNLTTIVVPSNRLSGTIPQSLQLLSGSLVQLDLSSNRLSGTLSEDLRVNSEATAFDLSVNRLSGPLPASFNVAPVLNVLDGNLFQCQKSNLPAEDPDYGDYICGSESLDSALETAIISFFLCFALMGLTLRNQNYWTASKESANISVMRFIWRSSTALSISASLVAGFLLLIYCVFKMVSPLKESYSTHSVQYLWTTTVAYLHGWAPVFVVLAVLYNSTIAVQWVRRINWTTGSPNIEIMKAASDPASDLSRARRVGVHNGVRIWILHVVNIVVVVLVNALYVEATLSGLSPQPLFAVQFFLGCFKLLWKASVIPFAVRSALGSQNELPHQIFMQLFSFVGGPFVSTFFTASNCFKYAFTGESAIQSSSSIASYDCYNYITHDCSLDSENCTIVFDTTCGFSDSQVVDVTVVPPWLYSYQCSSALVQDYVPVMVLSYAISGAIVPICFLLVLWMPPLLLNKMQRFIPKFLKKQLVLLTPVETVTASNQDDNGLPISSSVKLIRETAVVLKFLLNLTVLLTFGIASPLLAVIIALETFVQCMIRHLALGRFIELGRDKNIDGYSSALQHLIATRLPNFSTAFVTVFCFVGVFWCLFIFDMIGDVYGSLAGLLTMLFPLLLPAFFIIMRQCTQFGVTLITGQSNNIEMTVQKECPVFRPSDLNDKFDAVNA